MGESVALNIILICAGAFCLYYLREEIRMQIILENAFRISHGLSGKGKFETFVDIVKRQTFTKLVKKHASSHNVKLKIAARIVAKQLRETENA